MVSSSDVILAVVVSSSDVILAVVMSSNDVILAVVMSSSDVILAVVVSSNGVILAVVVSSSDVILAVMVSSSDVILAVVMSSSNVILAVVVSSSDVILADGKHHNQIDYILVKRRFHKGVNIARTRSFPGADIGSDHDLLMTTFHIRLNRISKPKPTRIKFDTEIKQDMRRAKDNWIAEQCCEI